MTTQNKNQTWNPEYVRVAERIQEFFQKYPAGIIEPTFMNRETFKEDGFIIVETKVWRDQTDGRATVGNGWCTFPGLTNFTRNSELMNAETTSVGRALAMLGLLVNRGMASLEEVNMANQNENAPTQTQVPPEVQEVPDEYWCSEHNQAWIKRSHGGHSHVIEGTEDPVTGKSLWCNMPRHLATR
jgi:hypothetical protein